MLREAEMPSALTTAHVTGQWIGDVGPRGREQHRTEDIKKLIPYNYCNALASVQLI